MTKLNIYQLLKGKKDEYHTAHMEADVSAPGNWEEAIRLIPLIYRFVFESLLTRMDGEDVVTFDELYMGLGCGDIPLYIAVHLLVINETFLCGQSPYLVDGPCLHTDMTFTLRPTLCPTCKLQLVDGVTMELMGQCVGCEQDANNQALAEAQWLKDQMDG